MEVQYKLASFDIVNLYTNIPIQETLNILKNNLLKTKIMDQQMINELIYILDIILKQNYFAFDGNFFIQKDGLAMGSPLSAILSEIYLNHYENTYLLSANNKFHKHIKLYKRYVDDTIVIFNGTERQLHQLLTHMNGINPNIKFTIEVEYNLSLIHI